MVNLAVGLRDARFGAEALAGSLRAIEAAGLRIERTPAPEDRFLAWLDDVFGGTWSSEAFSGKSAIARAGADIAGFATYDPRGLRFAWLRGWGAREDVGIFGPFGVAPHFRGSSLGPNLLVAALASLRECGYAYALIPAVGEEKLVEYYAAHCGASVVERFEKKRWQARRYRTTVLASGAGTNFQSVLDGSRSGRLPLAITTLLCNRAGAGAIERARDANVENVVTLLRDRTGESRAQYDARLLAAVERSEPELVLLLGWMHLLDDAFVARYGDAINIHPAFLPLDQRCDRVGMADGSTMPAFRGAHALADAIRARSPWTGASAHELARDADRGRVLVRKPLRIDPEEDEGAILKRLHPLEHRVLAGGIMRWVYEHSGSRGAAECGN